MPSTFAMPLLFESPSGKKTEGEAVCETYLPSERIKRALSRLLFFWLIAFFCIFIPIAHFVLVPGFFLGGIVAFFLTQSVEGTVLKGEGTCPDCDVFYEISRQQTKWPISVHCSHCYANFWIQAAPQNEKH